MQWPTPNMAKSYNNMSTNDAKQTEFDVYVSISMAQMLYR